MSAAKHGLSRRALLMQGALCLPAGALFFGAARRRLPGDWRDRLYLATTGCSCEAARGEVTALAPDGTRFRTNSTGLRLWPLLDGRHSGDDLVAALQQYGRIAKADAERDLVFFLSQLVHAGLVRML